MIPRKVKTVIEVPDDQFKSGLLMKLNYHSDRKTGEVVSAEVDIYRHNPAIKVPDGKKAMEYWRTKY